jgi:hypothetical protein
MRKNPESNQAYTKLEREIMYRGIELSLKELDPDEHDRRDYYGVGAWWD